MIGPVQESDREELVQLFRRNHPATPSRPLQLEPQHESQIFVVRDHGKIVGMTAVSYINVGLSRCGVIHEIDVAPGFDLVAVGRDLVGACRNWLTERDVLIVYTLPTTHAPATKAVKQTGESDLVMDVATNSTRTPLDAVRARIGLRSK